MPKTDVQVPIDVVPGRKRRIGIMGGTFDPIHHGHLVAASEVLSVFNLDEVVFVPTGRQPYKRDRKVTLAEHRYLMAVIATASNPRFSVSRVDIERGGTTYTIDTLRDLPIFSLSRAPTCFRRSSNGKTRRICGLWLIS